MEMLIIFFAYWSIGLLNILALLLFDRRITAYIKKQHMKTRKDQQEVKTRLTWIRKDLNQIRKGKK